jgi:alpha-beta hydrolase superfamily lysophospholipase
VRPAWVAALAAFLSLWTLTACASLTAPPGPGPTTPQITAGSFITEDGLTLPMRRWLPEGPPRAVVVAVHGFNDYSKAFDAVPGAPGVGPTLAAHGIAVFAYDQRGFGASPHWGLWPGADALTSDFTAVVRELRAAYPGVPLYGLGESMGGAVVMAALAGLSPPAIDGAILSSPAVWGRATMPAIYRVALWLGARLLPGWRPTGQSLGRMASDNIEMLRDNGRDPLFLKRTRIDSVYGLVGLMDQAFAASTQLRLPVLYLYGANDQIIPPGPSVRAMRQVLATNPKARAALYDRGWHMLSRDKNGPAVISDMAAWMADAAAPLPSAADQEALARLEVIAKKRPLGK